MPTREAVLAAARTAPSLGEHLASLPRLNPLYDGLRSALADWRRTRQLPAGVVLQPAAYEVLLRANLERARALPADLGARHLLVDVAGQTLLLVEGGRPVDTMRVVVGKPATQTPAMAALMRHVVLNPYWNLPPDLVPARVARPVLARGLSVLRTGPYEVLSDWTDAARPVDPAGIDWRSVAAGTTELRVRQLPGPRNMMGDVKFMFPNEQGIYLHDTPLRTPFAPGAKGPRAASAGCVRVEDAVRLKRWLFGGTLPAADGSPEQEVPLPAPVPVWIVYLTAWPKPGGGIAVRPDLYARDAALIARLARGPVTAAR